MLSVLVLAPLVGLAWGWASKRARQGLVTGLLVGAGNYALWTVYNAVTDHLGLDTVKNLLVNLGLFIVLGTVLGAGVGFLSARHRRSQETQGGEHGDLERHRPG